MGKKYTDWERMEIAVSKVNIQPIINEIHHNPLWLLAFIVFFFVVGNLLEILWILFRDLRRFLFRLTRYPVKKARSLATSVRLRLRKRYGKKKRSERSLWKKK